MTLADFRRMALALPETAEMPHFDLTSYRVKGKIFATYHAKRNCAMLKLTVVNQSIYCDLDNKVFTPYQVDGAKKALRSLSSSYSSLLLQQIFFFFTPLF